MYEQLVQHFGRSVTVWAPMGQSTDAVSVRATPLLASGGWPRWRRTFSVLRQITTESPDSIVIVGQILPLGIPVWLYSLVKTMPYAVVVHGMDVAAPLHVRRRAWLVKHIVQRAHVVFAANQNVARLVQSVAPSASIQVVYPSPYLQPDERASAERARTRASLNLEEKDVLVITVGRLVKRKGHTMMIQAIEQAVKQHAAIHYVIIGDGAERDVLEAQIKKSSARNHISFLGQCSDEQTKFYLAAADIFMMTPHASPDGDIEGVGIVYLEAASFGLAIIATRTGGVPEALDDGRVAMLVNEGDTAGIVRALVFLSQDMAARRRLGEAAQAYVAATFGVATQAQVMVKSL